MKPIINYKEHCKLRIRNADPSFFKHEIVKLLIMLISKQKYPDAAIYSEKSLTNNEIPDVTIDLGSEQIYYEVQKEISPQWIKSIEMRDLELDINTIIVPLKELSDNITELIKQLQVYVA